MNFSKLIFEKLIQFNKGAKSGNAVLLAGGAGSGKGYARSFFTNISDSYRVVDVDKYKELFLKINKWYEQNRPNMPKKYPEIAGLNLKNPDDVTKLHEFGKAKDVEQKLYIEPMIRNIASREKPNIMLDKTMKKWDELIYNLGLLNAMGYKSENIHLTWVLADYKVALQRNQDRSRTVDPTFVQKSHEMIANIWNRIIKGSYQLDPKQFNGEIYIINNAGTAANPKAPQASEWDYVKIKESGRPISMTKEQKLKIVGWMKQYTPPEAEVRGEA